MPIEILRAVIHGFDKDQHTVVVNEASIVKKNILLDITDPPVINLVNGLIKILGRRSNAQSWGRFSEDRGGRFPNRFKQDIEVWNNDNNFLQLTHLAVDELVEHARQKPTSTGSHLLFAHFNDDNNAPHLLVAMIKQKGGIQLDENFVPIPITEIDMSKLHQAADIRIEDYIRIKIDEAQPNEEGDEDFGEKELENYLSFLSQRDSGEASGYFVTALGCALGLTPKKATTSIIEATEKFFNDNAKLRPHKKAAREALLSYLTQQQARSEPASLQAVQQVLTEILPLEKKELVEEIDSFYNGAIYKIPSDFFVHSTALSKFNKVSIVSDELEIKMRRSILGKTANAKVYFNKEARTLTINQLSDAQIAQLERETD